jgi:hypothetical protein
MSWSGVYGQDENEQYKLPNLCARCGVNPRETVYGVSQTREKYQFGGRYKITTNYNVALCKECEAAVKRRERNGMIVTVLGLLVAAPAVIGLILNAQSGSTTSPLAIALGSTLVIGALTAFAGRSFGQPRFGNYNGKYFRFRNKAYHEAFGQLNPAFVRPAQR